ncbi:MAG TPA: nuclear transport factor 2 family protein [Propionibacteriaceae bacterium]|nr:nuclear transport factor 2 family protein [Propionibacteriaceae bacterium]
MALLVVQSATGLLFRVDPLTGVATRVDLGETLLTNGDGLLVVGTTLYVVQNRLNQVAVIKLSPDGTSGVLVDTLTSPASGENTGFDARRPSRSLETACIYPTRASRPRSSRRPSSGSLASTAVELYRRGMTLVIERLQQAQNARAAPRLAALFTDDYQSVQPAHPNRGFGGSSQVFANWSSIFANIPDFTAELLAWTVDGDKEWSEWHWHGTRTDGSVLCERGVIIVTVRNNMLAAARLYMEPTEFDGGDIETAVQEMTGSPTD